MKFNPGAASPMQLTTYTECGFASRPLDALPRHGAPHGDSLAFFQASYSDLEAGLVLAPDAAMLGASLTKAATDSPAYHKGFRLPNTLNSFEGYALNEDEFALLATALLLLATQAASRETSQVGRAAISQSRLMGAALLRTGMLTTYDIPRTPLFAERFADQASGYQAAATEQAGVLLLHTQWEYKCAAPASARYPLSNPALPREAKAAFRAYKRANPELMWVHGLGM